MAEPAEAFVVQPSRARIALVGIGLSVMAAVFLLMAVGAVVLAVWIGGTLALVVLPLLALVLLAIAAYLALLLSSLALRIEVGPHSLKMRLPPMRGPLPLLPLIRAELPYTDVVSVERRAEIYSSFGLVTVQHAFSLVTRDGRRLALGVMAERIGHQYPIDRVAEMIAVRAGCPGIDRGAVRVGGVLRAMIDDVPPWSTESLSVSERRRWDKRAARTVTVLMLLLAAGVMLRACFGS